MTFQTDRPVAYIAAVAGSLLIGVVAVFQLLHVIEIWQLRGSPDVLGLGIAAILVGYLLSVWGLLSGRFGSWIVPAHTALAIPVAALAVGVLTTAAALVVAIGLIGAEAYCGNREPVRGLRA